MECPTCNHLNSATSARCVNCGTTLIYEAAGHSEVYRKTADAIDSRMYSGIGSLFGFFVTAGLLKFVFTGLWLSDGAIYSAAVVTACFGAFVGRLFWKAQRDL